MSLRLIPTKPAKPFPVADRTRDGDLYADYHPRLRAIAHLRELVAAGRAGLDYYDETILIVDAREHDRVWTARACELTGLMLGSHVLADRGRRFRMVPEADVREELRLDSAPRMDEPLASRRVVDVDELQAAELNRALELLENPQTPVLRAVADARDAQMRAGREVH
jgi:hypothetical protein